MTGDYGEAAIRRSDDGRLVVDRADPVIGISLDLLFGEDGLGGEGLPIDESGCIVLAGDPRYRYRPVRFVAHPGDRTETARVLVCERVEDRERAR